MKFIDLFAGIGGFHKAMHELGHKCVFASEINPILQQAYEKSWRLKPEGDIKKIIRDSIDTVPEHDILCAGFPCQPFSKAGKREGIDDIESGDLFDEILKILRYRKPKFFILENVPHLAKHNNEETWKEMGKKLLKAGYTVDYDIYSPHEFGIPQHRERIFIVGSRVGLSHFRWLVPNKAKIDINDFIEDNPSFFQMIPKEELECLSLWQEFLDSIPAETKIPGFPIWSMEFGATYPFETQIPDRINALELSKYRGNFGCSLKNLTKREQMSLLPSYATVKKTFPKWKQRYIRENRKFYLENKKYIRDIVNRISLYESASWQKLEWNVGDDVRDIYRYIIQFRASGIRVKKSDYFPSLVCTNTQTPIIGWQKRYITKNEGLKLQSLEGVTLPDNDNAAFKALGNAVNSMIVKKIAENLLVEQHSIQITNNVGSLKIMNQEILEPAQIAV